MSGKGVVLAAISGLPAFVFALLPAPLRAQTPTDVNASLIDTAVRSIMQRDAVPGVSLALVKDGRIVYLRAYGYARLPNTLATTATRFAIGSVTKQLTAAAILLLVERGRLSLDDPVSKFLPNLTNANGVTIRNLLDHTSGYEDYLSQEYLPARVQEPTTVDSILQTWAQRPLDFPTGSQWQYSGTNYVIAGRIIELVTGETYERFLTTNLLIPLGITDADFVDESSPGPPDAVGYYRFGIGPPRLAPRAGRNWLFAMADLGMTAQDVARWDCALINTTLLSARSVAAMTVQTHTVGGDATGYGLGVFITTVAGTDGKRHEMVSHPGEISGFRSENWIVPDSKTALVVLTNAEYSSAAADIGTALEGEIGLVSTPPAASEAPAEKRIRQVLAGLGDGSIDRTQLSADASEMFTPQALRDIQTGLAGLGALLHVKLTYTQYRGGTTHYTFTADYELRSLQVDEYVLPNGKIEEFFLDAAR